MNYDIENAYLAKVIEKLQEKIEQLKEKIDFGEQQMEQMHDYFWNSYQEFDEYGYEMYDNTTAVNNKIKEKASYIGQIHRYKKMQDSPYFGRVDFCYDGEDTAEKCYIGTANLADSAAHLPYVYDWRAPISSLFYDFDEGPCSYEAPMGEISGVLTGKYQYKINHGKLIYGIKSAMNIHDDILKKELSEHADATLRSIVSTIQKHQNDIIRDKEHKILAVQGCAGSGKTSVALHRIAYLLYHNRKNLKASQVLILSPNSIFSDYISHILPELGEEQICEMSLDVYAYHKLRAIGEAEDKYDELEKIMHPECALIKRGPEASYKQTEAFVKELDGFILLLESELMDFHDFSFQRVIMEERKIAELFYEKLWDIPIMNRMERIGEFLIDEIETLQNKDMEEDLKLLLIDRMNQMYVTRDLLEIYNMFLEQSGRPCLQLVNGMIPYEDVYPLLYLSCSLWKWKDDREVKHLIIDEMQDYSFLQYRIIQKLFQCSMTFLGDCAQTMDEQQNDALTFLPKIFGNQIFSVRLDKSYRSTSEITSYAASILGMETVNCIDRHGELPDRLSCNSESEMVKLIRRIIQNDYRGDTFETIAILCQNQLESDKLYDLLVGMNDELNQDSIPVTLLNKDSKSFQKGVSIAPFYLAKGLEFDSVIIPYANCYLSDFEKQALYICCTRALHKLTLIDTTFLKSLTDATE